MELEARICICGCGMSFRVMPGSKQQYSAHEHEITRGGAWPGAAPRPRPTDLVSQRKAAQAADVGAHTIVYWQKTGRISNYGGGPRPYYSLAEVLAVASKPRRRGRRKRTHEEAEEAPR